MKFLAAYTLLALSGKKDITAADIKGVLGKGNIASDDADINRLIESVKGKKIHELIAQGTAKIGNPSAPVASGSAPAGKKDNKPADKPADKPAGKPEAPKKVAPPPAAEEEDDFMGGGLFGDD